MKTRRQFLALAGTGIMIPYLPEMANNVKHEEKKNYKLGIAGYTFKQFSVDEAIHMLKRVNISHVSLKDFHLPYDADQEKIGLVLEKFTASGIEVYALGVIYMKTKEFVDQAFEYAGKAGVKLMIGAPNYELLPYIDTKIKNYDFKLAIHNHGPDNPLYPNATDIWNHIQHLDKKIGICLDIGHTKRDGQDPSSDLEKYADRIYDIHIKDVDKSTRDGKTVEIGRGIINIPEFIRSLKKTHYSGMCSLEFEKDMDDPLAGIAESLGYWKGIEKAFEYC